MTVGLETERQIEAFEERRSSQAEERDRHTAPQPPLIQTGPTTNCPTKNWAELSMS